MSIFNMIYPCKVRTNLTLLYPGSFETRASLMANPPSEHTFDDKLESSSGLSILPGYIYDTSIKFSYFVESDVPMLGNY